MPTNKKVLTSTIEMGRPTIIAETPQVVSEVTTTDFLATLKRVSRRKGQKPSLDEAAS